jgi:hypothetical protein
VKTAVYLLVAIAFASCIKKDKGKFTSAKGHYVNYINISDTNRIIHLDDTIKFSFTTPHQITSSAGEQFSFKSAYHENSILIDRYYASEGKFYGAENGFYYGNIDNTKGRSYFSFADSQYVDYFIGRDTGVHFVWFAGSTELILHLNDKDAVWLNCLDSFPVADAHLDLTLPLDPNVATTLTKPTMQGMGYYCWRVVP